MPAPTPRILIVDDDEIIRLALSAWLEDEGCECLEAAGGEEALTLLEKESVHVAVVDVHMPGLNGPDFILRAHRSHPDMRFIIHSGSGDYRVPEELAAIGLTADHVFKKPILNMHSLSDAILRLVSKD